MKICKIERNVIKTLLIEKKTVPNIKQIYAPVKLLNL